MGRKNHWTDWRQQQRGRRDKRGLTCLMSDSSRLRTVLDIEARDYWSRLRSLESEREKTEGVATERRAL